MPQLAARPRLLAVPVQPCLGTVSQPGSKSQPTRVEPTEAGRLALRYAEEIFALGDELAEVLHAGAPERALAFRVGLLDSIPKSIAHWLRAVRAAAPPLPLRRAGVPQTPVCRRNSRSAARFSSALMAGAVGCCGACAGGGSASSAPASSRSQTSW